MLPYLLKCNILKRVCLLLMISHKSYIFVHFLFTFLFKVKYAVYHYSVFHFPVVVIYIAWMLHLMISRIQTRENTRCSLSPKLPISTDYSFDVSHHAMGRMYHCDSGGWAMNSFQGGCQAQGSFSPGFSVDLFLLYFYHTI